MTGLLYMIFLLALMVTAVASFTFTVFIVWKFLDYLTHVLGVNEW